MKYLSEDCTYKTDYVYADVDRRELLGKIHNSTANRYKPNLPNWERFVYMNLFRKRTFFSKECRVATGKNRRSSENRLIILIYKKKKNLI